MNKIKGFDGIRGLAVIAVILTHLHFLNLLENYHILLPAFKPLINGTAGVQAFFILSGFLITMLLIKEKNKTGSISIRNFFIRRTLRIFPLYFVFLLLSTFLYFLDNQVTNPISLIFSWAYIYNFIPKSHYTSFMGHTWSLAVEEHFYLIWPFVFIFLFRLKFTSRIMWVVGLILLSQIAHLLLMALHVNNSYFVERWTFVAGSNILMGCLLSMIILSEEWGERFAKYSTKLVLGIAVCLYVSTALFISDDVVVTKLLAPFIRSICISIFILYIFTHQTSRLVGFLEIRFLKYIGLISYGIYMYQGLFLATGPERVAGVLWPPSQTVGLILLVCVAPLSYHFFEKPFIELKSKFHNKNSH